MSHRYTPAPPSLPSTRSPLFLDPGSRLVQLRLYIEEAAKTADPGVPTVVDVDLGSRSYPIYIGSGLLDVPEMLQRHVHGKSVLGTFMDGEKYKNMVGVWKTLLQLNDNMRKIGRNGINMIEDDQ